MKPILRNAGLVINKKISNALKLTYKNKLNQIIILKCVELTLIVSKLHDVPFFIIDKSPGFCC